MRCSQDITFPSLRIEATITISWEILSQTRQECVPVTVGNESGILVMSLRARRSTAQGDLPRNERIFFFSSSLAQSRPHHTNRHDLRDCGFIHHEHSSEL